MRVSAVQPGVSDNSWSYRLGKHSNLMIKKSKSSKNKIVYKINPVVLKQILYVDWNFKSHNCLYILILLRNVNLEMKKFFLLLSNILSQFITAAKNNSLKCQVFNLGLVMIARAACRTFSSGGGRHDFLEWGSDGGRFPPPTMENPVICKKGLY